VCSSDLFHPFTGSESILVEAGSFVPVLRYIVTGGVQIFPQPKKCKSWCELTINFPESITVLSWDCTSTFGTPDIYYSSRISYNATQDWALAERTTNFELNSSSKYFCYYFQAYLVADRITIWHSDDLINSIADYVIGTQNILFLPNYDEKPVELNRQSIKQILEMPTYKTGDYLKIRIIPSVKETNYNTNWDLHVKCLEATDYDFCAETAHMNQACQAYDIDTIDFRYNTNACRFELLFTRPCPEIPSVSSLMGVTRYAGFSTTTGNTLVSDSTYHYGHGWTYAVKTSATSSYFISGYTTKVNTGGKISVSKTGNVVTFVCDSETDYLDFKYSYEYWNTHVLRTDFVDDNTDLKYYRGWIIPWIESGSLGCGDSEISKQWNVHIKSTFVWDDDNYTFTITLFFVTNGMAADGVCEFVYSNTNGRVSAFNSFYNLADFTNVETYCRSKYPLGWAVHVVYQLGSTSASLFRANIWNVADGIPCSLPITRYLSLIYFYQFYMDVQILASRDSEGNWLENPLENFRVVNRLNKAGAYLTQGIEIYKIVNNIVVTKVYWEDLP